MSRVFLILISFVFILSSCKEDFVGHSGPGKVPVYLPISELNDIQSLPPQAVEQSGPIFLIGDFFFMIEVGQGIHIFDISDEQQESSLSFIKIPAVTDFTIEGNILYADSWKDLVTIDITDLLHVVFLNRTNDVFDPFLYPPLFNGPFECVDERKGAVVGWTDQALTNVLCHTVN